MNEWRLIHPYFSIGNFWPVVIEVLEDAAPAKPETPKPNDEPEGPDLNTPSGHASSIILGLKKKPNMNLYRTIRRELERSKVSQREERRRWFTRTERNTISPTLTTAPELLRK